MKRAVRICFWITVSCFVIYLTLDFWLQHVASLNVASALLAFPVFWGRMLFSFFGTLLAPFVLASKVRRSEIGVSLPVLTTCIFLSAVGITIYSVEKCMNARSESEMKTSKQTSAGDVQKAAPEK